MQQNVDDQRKFIYLVSAMRKLPFTPRESDIARHLFSGWTRSQIARALGIKNQSVRRHVMEIRRKLGVTDGKQESFIRALQDIIKPTKP